MTTTTPTKAQHLCTLIDNRDPGAVTPEFATWAETLDDAQLDKLIASVETLAPAPERDLPVEGDKVVGKCCDIPFSGTVTELNFHTINHQAYWIKIRLTAPIVLFGREETSILMMVYRDGKVVGDVHRKVANPDYVWHA